MFNWLTVDDGCVTSHRLNWGLFLLNEVRRVAQDIRKWKGRKDGKDGLGLRSFNPQNPGAYIRRDIIINPRFNVRNFVTKLRNQIFKSAGTKPVVRGVRHSYLKVSCRKPDTRDAICSHATGEGVNKAFSTTCSSDPVTLYPKYQWRTLPSSHLQKYN